MDTFKRRLVGISVAVAHGIFSGSLNILIKLLISNYHFNFLMLLQLLTNSTTALTLEILRRLGKVKIPPFSIQLSKVKSDQNCRKFSFGDSQTEISGGLQFRNINSVINIMKVINKYRLRDLILNSVNNGGGLIKGVRNQNCRHTTCPDQDGIDIHS